MSTHGPAATAREDLHPAPGFLLWTATLVRTHRLRLLAYARRRGLDAQEALDVVQDSFVSFLGLHEARDVARDSGDALKLLTVLVRHNLQNHKRKRTRHGTLVAVDAEAMPALGETSESLLMHAEELARVRGCILRMQGLQRRVVQLALLDEQPNDEVARVLGIASGHVRVLLHRAREHIRNCDFGNERATL